MPKVSIILPNYNYARYLDERIQSLLKQTYSDFELIIVDDASTDSSLEVIYRYTDDPRVQTLFFDQNSGLPYKRWNDGAEIATGDYILFAGADDSCHPTLLEKLVEKLDANPNVGIAFSQSLEIDSEGKVIRSYKQCTDDLSKVRWKDDFVDSGSNECCYMIVKNTIPNASAALLRRKTFEDAGRFDETLRLVADWMLWARMLLIADIAFVAAPLNYFRRHCTTVRSNSMAYGLHIQEELKVVSFLEKNASVPATFVEKAYNRITNRWVNSIARLTLTKPGLVGVKASAVYRVIKDVDPKINWRLTRRVAKDITTLGILTLREHSFKR